MAKVSKTTAEKVVEFPAAEDRASDVDGITISFVTIKETHDLAPMLAVLPEGHCKCPHWGYVLQGQLTITYRDRVEIVGAGDAFYMTPGHTPAAMAGTEFVMFSPTDEYQATDTAITAGLAARAKGSVA